MNSFDSGIREKLIELLNDNRHKKKKTNPLRVITSDSQRRGGTLSAPLAVMLDLTNDCNQACFFCYRSGASGLRKNGGVENLTEDSLRSLCSIFRDSHVASITLTGGEPTCNPKFPDLLRIVKSYGFTVNIMTNGTNFTPELAREIAGIIDPRIDTVELSYDAADPTTYRMIRGMDGLGSLQSTLGLFREFSIPFITITLALKNNRDQLSAIIDSALAHGAREVSVELPFPKKNVDPKHYLTIEEALDIYGRLSLNYAAAPVYFDILHMAIATNTLEPIMQYIRSTGVPANVCHAGYSSCAVDIRGNVHICQFLIDSDRLFFGNVYETPFPELWHKITQSRIEIQERLRSCACSDCGCFDLCLGACPALVLESTQGSQDRKPCSPTIYEGPNE